MTTRKRKMRIAKTILVIHSVPIFCCMAVFLVLYKPTLALIDYVHRRREHGLDKLELLAADLRRRATDLEPELGQFNQLSEERKVQVSAAHYAWLADVEAHSASIDALRVSTTYAVLNPVLDYVGNKFFRRRQKINALDEIVSRLDCDTFYLDLLLWFILPDAFGEALLGDLNEEYQIRKSTDGPVRARSWYRHQVATTVKDCLWRKIERLAAIGTLIDLLSRSHKK
jgi:hypothetical protein